MSKLQNGTAALVVAVALLGGTAFAANVQGDGDSDDSDPPVAAGTLDDGDALLPLAGISIDAAIEAAQGAAAGAVGEVDLEYAGGVLFFTVDIGTRDVKIDAWSGAVLSSDAED